MKKLWLLFTAVLALSFSVLGWVGTRIYQEAPPLQVQVVTTEGTVLIPSGDFKEEVEAVAMSPDGQWYAWGTNYGGQLHINNQLGSIRTQTLEGNRPFIFSPDSKTLATTHILWDPAQGKKTFSLKSSDPPTGTALTFNPKGTVLAVGGKKIQLWEVATGKQLAEIPNPDGDVYGLAFHPRKRIIAVGSHPGIVTLWHVPAAR